MRQKNIQIKLYPKQATFVANRALTSLFMGGVGSGKTHAGSVKSLTLALEFPRETGLIVANTYPQLRHSTLPLFFSVLEDAGIDYNWSEGKKELYIYAHRKLTIRTYSLDHPGRIQGQTVPWVWADEARDMDQDSFEELLKRCRGKRDYLPVFMTTSPPEIPHWRFDMFEGKCDGRERYMIRAFTKENPTLSAERAAQELYAE